MTPPRSSIQPLMASTDATAALVHDALLYESTEDFVRGICAFIAEGLRQDEPVMVAVPGDRIPHLRRALGPDAERVDFADMTELGRNPARIIPALRAWLDEHPGQRTRLVGEPIWPGRTRDEVAEATWHEGLLNLAFADTPTSILCPYDVRQLDPSALSGVACTHPTLVEGDRRHASTGYLEPACDMAGPDWPLPDVPAGAQVIPITRELRRVREAVQEQAAALGLSRLRTADLLVAVNEAATNSLVHGAPPAVLRVWRDGDDLVCEISDAGLITDPLVGRQRPDTAQEGGRGLWLIHQLCDLSQLRSDAGGTTLRLHMHRDG